jgi:hypothetical protein
MKGSVVLAPHTKVAGPSLASSGAKVSPAGGPVSWSIEQPQNPRKSTYFIGWGALVATIIAMIAYPLAIAGTVVGMLLVVGGVVAVGWLVLLVYCYLKSWWRFSASPLG